MGTPQERITAYLERFTEQRPQQTRYWLVQPTMSEHYTTAQIADALLADAEFRALKLGTWLSTPDGQLVTSAVIALSPPPYQQDIELLTEALQLAAARQQAEARQKIAIGLLGRAVLAAAIGSSRG
jgi:methylmalonyl-CoA mutase cobalamin-binding subunit